MYKQLNTQLCCVSGVYGTETNQTRPSQPSLGGFENFFRNFQWKCEPWLDSGQDECRPSFIHQKWASNAKGWCTFPATLVWAKPTNPEKKGVAPTAFSTTISTLKWILTLQFSRSWLVAGKSLMFGVSFLKKTHIFAQHQTNWNAKINTPPPLKKVLLFRCHCQKRSRDDTDDRSGGKTRAPIARRGLNSCGANPLVLITPWRYKCICEYRLMGYLASFVDKPMFILLFPVCLCLNWNECGLT